MLEQSVETLLISRKASSSIRVFSFGGGVQSHAALVLQAQGRLPLNYSLFMFANVGNDSENPATLRYIEEYTKPFCRKHGIPFQEVQKTRYGQPDTLLESIYRDTRSVPIPAYQSGGSPGNRSCTVEFKLRTMDKALAEQGYSHAVYGVGFSTDEFTRVRSDQEAWHYACESFVQGKMPMKGESEASSTEALFVHRVQATIKGKKHTGLQVRKEYPLITLRLTRSDCMRIITGAGLPMPPKSSCWFCPFHRKSEWIEMKRDEPELFAKALSVEARINEKRADMGRDAMYLHSSAKPLLTSVGDQARLFEDDPIDYACKTGNCMT